MNPNFIMTWDIDKDGQTDVELHISKEFMHKISVRFALWIMKRVAGLRGVF